MFDPIAWAIGFVLNTTLKKCADALLERKDLSAKLWRTIDQWAKDLPLELRSEPYALFADLTDSDRKNPQDYPAAAHLGTTLAKGIVPSQQIWFDALLERHRSVRTRLGGEAAVFFRLPDSRATPHLEDLASKLARVCMEDAGLFQVTVLSHLASEGGRNSTNTIRLHVLAARVEALPHAPSKAIVRFTLTNLTQETVKITVLQLRTVSKSARRIFRLPDVAAPISEFALVADIRNNGVHNFLANIAVQFVLTAGDSDAFSLSLFGEEGWEYELAIECTAESLESARTFDASPGHVSVLYPIRTVGGLAQRA